MPLFLTCKQVSHHLSKEDYDKLPPLQKFMLKFHVVICPICGAYNKQVMKFQDMVRNFRKREEDALEREDPAAPRLDADRREKIKQALREAEQSESGPR